MRLRQAWRQQERQASRQPEQWVQWVQRLRAWAALRELRQVFREEFLFPIEPSQREQLSPRPELRAAPPSVSVHLPAAVTRGIWFRPA